jgi:hypothetical protein
MMGFFKNLLVLTILNISIFYLLQIYIINSLVFEKVTVSSLILAIFLIIIKKINYQRLTIILTIYICLTQVFVNIDRSKSFHILYWIENNEIDYNLTNLTFLDKVPDIKSRTNEFDFIQRVQEHKIRGLVTQKGKQISLTSAGEIILKISDLCAKYFRLKGWVGNS